jgi:lipoate-protein ligase B
MPDLAVVDLGRLPWEEAWAIQREYVAKRKSGLVPDTLLFVEHPHVFTLGRNADPAHILAPREWLAQQGISVQETNRGGDVTYHGPGQLVGYPIMDLAAWRKDVRAFVEAIAAAVVRTLAGFGLKAYARAGKETGVWVGLPNGEAAKVCALGIHLSRWVSCHGFALNINPDLRYFQHIVPCGLTAPVTSLAALGVDARREEVMATLSRRLAEIFHLNLSPTIEHLQETLP